MTIAHLTKAIALKDDFLEARLMRAEALLKMKQYKETMEDIDAVLAQNPEEETAILLRGKVKEANGQEEEAEADGSTGAAPLGLLYGWPESSDFFIKPATTRAYLCFSCAIGSILPSLYCAVASNRMLAV